MSVMSKSSAASQYSQTGGDWSEIDAQKMTQEGVQAMEVPMKDMAVHEVLPESTSILEVDAGNLLVVCVMPRRKVYKITSLCLTLFLIYRSTLHPSIRNFCRIRKVRARK